MLEVSKADYVDDYVINISFNNGKVGSVDLQQTVFDDTRPVFAKLRKQSNFKNFTVEHSTIVWSDELDLAAEYLFYLAFKDDATLQEQFKSWGYVKRVSSTNIKDRKTDN